MNEAYHQIHDELLKNHFENTQDVCNREANFSSYYNGNHYVQEESDNHTSWTFSLKFKVFLFLCSVLFCSCYIYGNGDVKKGVKMAYAEAYNYYEQIEDKHPEVKETVSVIKKNYNLFINETKEIFDDNKND